MNDERRRGRLTTGRWPNNHMMTAVDMRRVQLSGTMSLSVHPEIDSAPEAAAPEDGDALLEPPPDDVLERDTKEHLGWRCSYSKLETEPHKAERFLAYLSAQRRALEGKMALRQEAKRHAPGSSRDALEKQHVAKVAKATVRGRTRAARLTSNAGV